MCNSIEWGRCEICGKETQLERTYFYYPIHCECCGNKFDGVSIDYIFATDWEIYNEPKPEPKFEIGELVMMRDRIDLKWFPEHFAHYEPKKEVPYMAISGRDYVQCAKFDKDIVFTNKPAKL